MTETKNQAYNRELKVINKKHFKNTFLRTIVYCGLGTLGGIGLGISPNADSYFSGNPIIREYKQTDNLLAHFRRQLENYNIIIPDGISAKTRQDIHEYNSREPEILEALVTDLRQDSLRLAQIMRPYTQFKESLNKEQKIWGRAGLASLAMGIISPFGTLAFFERKRKKDIEQLKQKYHIE